MTVLSSSSNAEENPPLAELRRLKSRAQNGERRRQLQREQREAVKKINSKPADSEPKEAEKTKQRNKKRNFLKWLFTPSVATNRQVGLPPPRIRVKIPIVYRNGEHKGVVVGGRRVPFSRPMQANRRNLMLSQDDTSSSIPEHTELLLQFPTKFSREKCEAEQTRKMKEMERLKEEKLAKELAK